MGRSDSLVEDNGVTESHPNSYLYRSYALCMEEIVEEYLSKPEDERAECYVCGNKLPTQQGGEPVEGERYVVIRENIPSEVSLMTQRPLHTDCLTEYLDQRDG